MRTCISLKNLKEKGDELAIGILDKIEAERKSILNESDESSVLGKRVRQKVTQFLSVCSSPDGIITDEHPAKIFFRNLVIPTLIVMVGENAVLSILKDLTGDWRNAGNIILKILLNKRNYKNNGKLSDEELPFLINIVSKYTASLWDLTAWLRFTLHIEDKGNIVFDKEKFKPKLTNAIKKYFNLEKKHCSDIIQLRLRPQMEA